MNSISYESEIKLNFLSKNVFSKRDHAELNSVWFATNASASFSKTDLNKINLLESARSAWHDVTFSNCSLKRAKANGFDWFDENFGNVTFGSSTQGILLEIF